MCTQRAVFMHALYMRMHCEGLSCRTRGRCASRTHATLPQAPNHLLPVEGEGESEGEGEGVIGELIFCPRHHL